MIHTWIIEDKLAISPQPSFRDIEFLAKVFNAVVVLIEPHEVYLNNIDLYLSKWQERGVEVYYAPTPDYYPVDLLELYFISKWIDEQLRKGSRVLIHCYGGIGRSGMVAAAYLLFGGWELYEAIKHVRSRRPGAVETNSQHRVLEDYYILLRNIDRDVFDEHVVSIKNNVDKVAVKHISKTLQLLIELYEHFDLKIDLEKTIYATLYHCFSEEELVKLLEKNIVTKELINILKNNSLESVLIKLAHTLDYCRDLRVVYTESYVSDNKVVVVTHCSRECRRLLEKLMKSLNVLNNLIKLNIDFQEQPYEY